MELSERIYLALKFFGPITLRDLQGKLDAVGLVKSQNEIDDACQTLLKSKRIREATGFNDIAYKV